MSLDTTTRYVKTERIRRLQANGVYHLRNESTQASVLLPETLPLKEKAVKQLMSFAAVRSYDGHRGVCMACATPDFHPGSIVPVGTIVATDPDFVIPSAIGTDVNCSVRLMSTGLNLSQLEPHKAKLVKRLTGPLLTGARDLPVNSDAFRALFDVGPAAFIDSIARNGLWATVDLQRLHAELGPCASLEDFRGSSQYAPPAHVGSEREAIRDPGLGTQGSGNHFSILEIVDEVLDRHAAYRAGLNVGDVVVMIHTGSRDVGFYVGRRWIDRAKAEWPVGLKHPEAGLYGLSGGLADEYLVAMGTAARYAWLNRVAIGELIRKEIAEMTGVTSSRLVADVSHNVVSQENGLNIHRKGATPARNGEFALIPGSMGDASYLVTGLGNPDWLWSCSHGAGRSVRRQATRRLRSANEDATWSCVTLREDRRIEEAPEAYKPIGQVIEAQERAGLIKAAVRLKPWITFKA